jgi:hypothetical protein
MDKERDSNQEIPRLHPSLELPNLLGLLVGKSYARAN